MYVSTQILSKGHMLLSDLLLPVTGDARERFQVGDHILVLLTLLLVIFAALTYIDRHNKK